MFVQLEGVKRIVSHASVEARNNESNCIPLLHRTTMDLHHLAMIVCAMSQIQISGYSVCGEEQSVARAWLHSQRMGLHAVRQITASKGETWPRNRLDGGLKHLKHETLDKEMRNRYPSDVLELRCV